MHSLALYRQYLLLGGLPTVIELLQDCRYAMSSRDRANQRLKVLALHLEAEEQEGEGLRQHVLLAADAACLSCVCLPDPPQTAGNGAALERQLTLAGLGTTEEFEFAQVGALSKGMACRPLLSFTTPRSAQATTDASKLPPAAEHDGLPPCQA